MQVRYEYTEPVVAPFGQGPGSTVDIGIFDSRGHEFLDGAGFRGWSGSARRGFFVGANDATPGYIRGPMFPGEWRIVLGLARTVPAGVAYDVSVELTVDGREAEGETPRPQAARPRQGNGKAGWLKGDLHSHTVHSDGLNTVEEVVHSAIERGLDFLAVTDHNTTTHHEELARLSHLPITLIPGEEITTYWGHANTWGLREWVDFRCADAESMAAVQRFVREKGGLISVNHPKSVGPPWLLSGWSGYTSMEVWQAPWRFYNWESLERWDERLRAGERIVAVGGSDVHSIAPKPPRHPHGLGNPTTWVYSEDGASEEGILDSIRKGRVFISDDPRGAQLMLTADADGDGTFETMMGDAIEPRDGRPVRFRAWTNGGMDRKLWIIADGLPLDVVPLDRPEATHEFSLDVSGRRYVRAELRGYRGRPERGEVVWAMTNPIWVGS